MKLAELDGQEIIEELRLTWERKKGNGEYLLPLFHYPWFSASKFKIFTNRSRKKKTKKQRGKPKRSFAHSIRRQANRKRLKTGKRENSVERKEGPESGKDNKKGVLESIRKVKTTKHGK